MRNNFEIPYRNLKYTCDPSIFKFTTTADVKSNYKGLGQQRGIASLEFGLSVDTKGYNVYLEGPTGSGKTTYTKEYLDKISRTKKVPPDWVYVYNFDDPNEPVAISLTAGEGIKFKDSMEKFVKDIRHDIRNTFKSDELEKEKSIITREFEERKEKFLNDLNKKSAKYGFQVKSSETGIYMMPIVDGKVIKEDEFEKLDAEIKKEYEDKSEIVQQEIIEVIGKIRALDAEAENRINDWRTNIALLTISGHIYYVKSNLKRNKKVSTFLDGVKKDILKNISKFIDDDKNKEKDNDNSVKKNIDAKITDENNRESMADIFLKDHKVVTKYDKDKDQTTYELTFKRYDVDKPSVSKLYVKNGEDFKEANLANEDKGVNTFKFIRKGEPEKSIIIKMYIPAMNAEKTAKLTLNVKNEIAKSEITSLEGENRYDTACKISKKLYPKTNKRAVLASGQVTVDALSTSLFASKKGAPILLTKSSYLPSETIRELKRLGVSEVSIIGGYNTINRQVTDELRAMGISTERIYGSDRYDTAIELAKKTGSDLKKLVIVNGVNYADAISISGYCAQNDYNMILTNGKSLSDGDMSLIKKSDEVIIVGGDKSISNDLERKIDMIAKKTRRISGYDRYETSLKLSEELYTKTDEILMAAGDNDKMTDALAGSQLAAYKKAPLQLVSNYMTSRQKKYIEDKKISNATILGGINSIGRSMRESIKSLIVKD